MSAFIYITVWLFNTALVVVAITAWIQSYRDARCATRLHVANHKSFLVKPTSEPDVFYSLLEKDGTIEEDTILCGTCMTLGNIRNVRRKAFAEHQNLLSLSFFSCTYTGNCRCVKCGKYYVYSLE